MSKRVAKQINSFKYKGEPIKITLGTLILTGLCVLLIIVATFTQVTLKHPYLPFDTLTFLAQDVNDYEILHLELKKDRTGSFAMYWGGKLKDSDILKNWMANDRRLFITYDDGETESVEYTFSGNKLILGDVLYQKQ